MAKSGKKHPLRKLTFVAVIAGVVIAIRNSIADKGGSYPPPATPDRVPATPPAQPVKPEPTAEPAAEAAPVEEATPRTGDVPHAKDFVDSDADDEEADRAPSRGHRLGPALARDEEIAESKIDPFGIR